MSDTRTTDEIVIEETAPPAPPAPKQETVQIPVDPPKPVEQPSRTFTAEDIERARREEKEKLYPRLQTMEEELATVRREREEREAATAEAERLAEEARIAAERETMSAAERIEAISAEMQARVQAAEDRAAAVEATWQQEQRLQALGSYRSQKVAEYADHLIPELADLVTGNSEEEIDNALALVLDKSAAIMEQVAAATQQQRQTQRGASVTAPPVGPMDNETTYQTLTPQDIAAMDPQTYAQHRDKLMAAVMNKARSGGLYER